MKTTTCVLALAVTIAVALTTVGAQQAPEADDPFIEKLKSFNGQKVVLTVETGGTLRGEIKLGDELAEIEDTFVRLGSIVAFRPFGGANEGGELEDSVPRRKPE